MHGHVTPERRVLIALAIRDGSGIWNTIDVAIDTGFTGQLALPEEYVRQLDLNLDRMRRATPAIGQTRIVSSGFTQLLWDGTPHDVRVIQAGTSPLLGMEFLWNHRITIDAVADGAVSITPLFNDRMFKDRMGG